MVAKYRYRHVRIELRTPYLGPFSNRVYGLCRRDEGRTDGDNLNAYSHLCIHLYCSG